MIDFEGLKRQIDLQDLILREYPQGRIRKVGRSFRCNPCPLCGHHDCFTFSSDHFFCFSCGEQGDAVDLIQHTKNVTNIAAIQYLANIICISHDGECSRPSSQSEPSQNQIYPQDRLQKKGPDMSEEKRDELCSLRRITAEYFHQQLMGNKAALEYQTNVRKHSKSILEYCLIGYTAGSIVSHIEERGIDPTCLLEIGLARQVGTTLREYLPRNSYVYPHFFNDQVLFFTVKDPNGRLKYQISKTFTDPDWVCYGQDALAQNECLLAEGENDRLSVMDAGELHCAATIGAFCHPEVTSWLAHNAQGRTYFLCFDSDSAGRKYEAHYSRTIIEAGGKVRIIHV